MTKLQGDGELHDDWDDNSSAEESNNETSGLSEADNQTKQCSNKVNGVLCAEISVHIKNVWLLIICTYLKIRIGNK